MQTTLPTELTTITPTATPAFTRLPRINKYFPNYTNKSETEISSDILALQELGIIPIATKSNQIYYNIEQLIVYTKSQTYNNTEQLTPTTTQLGEVTPTSIPPINVFASDNNQYSGDEYLTYKATGAVYESDTVMSLPKMLTPAYDNSNFVFSSKYDWYYVKNGEKIEVLSNMEHEISLSVLASTSIYINVSSTTSTSPTTTVTETMTTSPQQARSVRYGFMWN